MVNVPDNTLICGHKICNECNSQLRALQCPTCRAVLFPHLTKDPSGSEEEEASEEVVADEEMKRRHFLPRLKEDHQLILDGKPNPDLMNEEVPDTTRQLMFDMFLPTDRKYLAKYDSRLAGVINKYASSTTSQEHEDSYNDESLFIHILFLRCYFTYDAAVKKIIEF